MSDAKDKETTKAAPEEAKEAPKKAERTKEQKAESFKKIRAYAGRECFSLIIGLIFLVGGLTSDLLIPLFIGEVVDYLTEEEYDKVGKACLVMLGLVVVSTQILTCTFIRIVNLWFCIVLGNLCGYQSWYFQHFE